jgi:ferrous iron transport protein B
LVAVFAYILGIVCVLISGVILKKTKYFAGAASTFIMELPQYHLPSSLTVLSTTLERGWQFVKKAGTFILLASGLIWFLSSFGWNMSLVDDVGNSILASIGNSICWIFSPLGWGDDWQFSVATITGLLAKENVVGTFGVLFSYGEVSESGMEIWNILSTMLTSSAALSFLAFNLICAPCFAAIGAMKRELGTWRRTLAAAAYQCTLAYLVAMMIYQFGTFIEYRTIGIGLIVAVVVLIMMVAMMVSKDPFRSSDRCGEADAQ